MSRFFRIQKSFLIFFLLAACTPISIQSPEVQPTMLHNENQSIAKSMIEQMVKGDIAAVYAHFDANLQFMMSEAQLKETWEQITAQVGAFQKEVDTRVDEQQGHQIVTVTCQFEKALLEVKLGFNGTSQVTGLAFSQAQIANNPPDHEKPGSFQEINRISLKAQIWFGLHLGSQVRSPMKLSVTGPANLHSVTFLIDGTPMGSVQRIPFEYSFHTDDYPPGWHDLTAIGQASDGMLLQSNTAHYRFLSAAEGNQILALILVGVLLLGLGIWLFQFGNIFQKNRQMMPMGTPRKYGITGGAICPKCGRPFSLHGFPLEILSGKPDRCPYCGRMGIFHRISPFELRQAEGKEIETAQPEMPTWTVDDQQELRRQVENSRYDGN